MPAPRAAGGITWSPDSKRALIRTALEGGPRLLQFDASAGSLAPIEVAPGEIDASVTSTAYSPDGRSLALAWLDYQTRGE